MRRQTYQRPKSTMALKVQLKDSKNIATMKVGGKFLILASFGN
jgi:hypothetical protein